MLAICSLFSFSVYVGWLCHRLFACASLVPVPGCPLLGLIPRRAASVCPCAVTYVGHLPTAQTKRQESNSGSGRLYQAQEHAFMAGKWPAFAVRFLVHASVVPCEMSASTVCTISKRSAAAVAATLYMYTVLLCRCLGQILWDGGRGGIRLEEMGAPLTAVKAIAWSETAKQTL